MHLKKSPCRDCDRRKMTGTGSGWRKSRLGVSECWETCEKLAQVQREISRVPSTGQVAGNPDYDISEESPL